MRILHICTTQYSDGWSYQENLLAKYHRKMGHEVWVITSPYCYKDGKLVEDSQEQFMDCNGVNVIRLKRRGGLLPERLPQYRNFYKTIEKIAPDFIFSHGCQYRDVYQVERYIKRHKKCCLKVDNHADFNNSALNWLSRHILHGIIWKYYAQRIDPFVTKWYGVLPARVDFLHDVYGICKDRIDLLVMGADDERVKAALQPAVRQAIRKQYGIREDDFLIITGGKIGHGKRRVIDLMDVVNHLPRDDVKLIVFGSVISELMSLVQERCSDRVQYIGWVESAESSNYLAAADLAVYPGLHSVLWEQTVALGIPVICTRFPGMEHIDLGGNVRFIGAEGSKEIDQAIKDVLDGDRYLEMKRIAQEKGIKAFSYSEIASRSIRVEA